MTADGCRLAMFPLGSVLFPYGVLALNVFEPRYRALLSDCLATDVAEFGVVLIERGHEVGGGDARFGVGTVAHIVEVAEAAPGVFNVQAVGGRRVRVGRWLPEDPYPAAVTEGMAALEFDAAAHGSAFSAAERQVRRALALRSELGEPTWPATVQLDAEPVVAAWQLAGVAPIGQMDQLQLLEAPDMASMLDLLVRLTQEECEVLASRLAWG
jgi:hypothetical protein